jgi:hypothetical protein
MANAGVAGGRRKVVGSEVKKQKEAVFEQRSLRAAGKKRLYSCRERKCLKVRISR